jgi:hypothetical protein
MAMAEIGIEDKEQYVETIRELRAMISSGRYAGCPCPKSRCEWHGQCFECVMVHRYHQEHVPCCMQPMLRKKIAELAGVAEMVAEPKPLRPEEYYDYLQEACPRSGNCDHG